VDEIKGHVAEQTRAQHRTAAREFMAWAGDQTAIEQVTRRKAGDYIGQYLLRSDRSRRTIKRIVSSLSAFWRWLVSRGQAQDNPWREHQLGHPKKGGYERRGFSDADLMKLLSGFYTERYGAVLHELIRLAVGTGARLDELCSLRSRDAEKREDGWWLTIIEGKTEAAERVIPVHSCMVPTVERLVAHQSAYLIDGLKPGGPDKKRSWYVSKAFRRYRERVGVVGPLRDFHALRNTFIEAMEAAEVPEPTVKLLVGHKRSSLTYGHYSKGTRVELRQAIEKLAYSAEVMQLLERAPPPRERPVLRRKSVASRHRKVRFPM
jgi:integrase